MGASALLIPDKFMAGKEKLSSIDDPARKHT